MNTNAKKELLRLEALEWIAQAADLLDQAHATLRDLGLHKESFRASNGNSVTVEQVYFDTEQLLRAIAGLRFCQAPGCQQPADQQSPATLAWLCDDHSY